SPTTIPQTISTCPTTPRTERMITMSWVIGREGIRRRGGRYADRAVVAELVRRARLKIGWPSGRAGSSPAPGIVVVVARVVAVQQIEEQQEHVEDVEEDRGGEHWCRADDLCSLQALKVVERKAGEDH